jgi:hypothetical protein
MKTSEKALALCHAIEAAGASEALTKCSVLASELHTEIVKWEAIERGCIDGAGRASLLEAIEEIASQVTTSEMHPSAHCEADFEAAYDRCVKIARDAQAAHAR